VLQKSLRTDGFAKAQMTATCLKAMNADAVLFFSPSAVEGFDRGAGREKLAGICNAWSSGRERAGDACGVASAGITTAAAAKEPSVAENY